MGAASVAVRLPKFDEQEAGRVTDAARFCVLVNRGTEVRSGKDLRFAKVVSRTHLRPPVRVVGSGADGDAGRDRGRIAALARRFGDVALCVRVGACMRLGGVLVQLRKHLAESRHRLRVFRMAAWLVCECGCIRYREHRVRCLRPGKTAPARFIRGAQIRKTRNPRHEPSKTFPRTPVKRLRPATRPRISAAAGVGRGKT